MLALSRNSYSCAQGASQPPADVPADAPAEHTLDPCCSYDVGVAGGLFSKKSFLERFYPNFKGRNDSPYCQVRKEGVGGARCGVGVWGVGSGWGRGTEPLMGGSVTRQMLLFECSMTARVCSACRDGVHLEDSSSLPPSPLLASSTPAMTWPSTRSCCTLRCGAAHAGTMASSMAGVAGGLLVQLPAACA